MQPMKLMVVLLALTATAGAAYGQQKTDDSYEFLMAKLAADQENFGDALSRLDKVVADDPENGVLLYERGVILLDANRIPEGEKQLREVVRLHPDFYDAQRLLGRVLLDEGKSDKAKMAEALDHIQAAFKLRPSDLSTGVTLSQLLVADKRLPEAEKVLASLAEQDPDQKIINYNYAQVLTKLGKTDESRVYLERVIEADPTFAPAVLQLLDIYRSRQEYGKAADLLEPIITEQPLNLDLQRQQALLYLQADQPEKARKRLEEVLKADPEDVQTRYYMAESLNEGGDLLDAEKIYRTLLEKTPADSDLVASFGANQLAQRHYDEAEKAYRQLLALPSLPDNMVALGHSQLALVDYERQNYDGALAEAKKALVFNGTPNMQAINLAIDSLEKQKNEKDALGLINPLVRDYPAEPLLVGRQIELLSKTGNMELAVRVADDLARRGKKPAMIASEAFVEAGKYREAKQVLEGLSKQQPDDPDVLFELGAVTDRSGDKAGAEHLFLEVLQKNPEHAGTLNYLGYMWAEQGVNLDRAAQMLEVAVRKEPENGAYIDSLGWVYFRQGKLDLAQKYLTDATRLLPRDPTVLEHLGDVLLQQGKYPEALERYRTALALGPEPKDESELRTKIAGAEKQAH